MLVVTTGAILITSIDRIILPTVLPAILDDFGLTETQGGILVSLAYAGSAIGGVVLGAFGDGFGRGPRRAVMWGVSVFISVIGAVGTAISATLLQLQALRVVMGIGTGAMEPINVAMVGEWWQQEDRGFAIGTHHTGFPIGQFVGPILISAILAVATWEVTFLLIPLIAIPIVVGQYLLASRENLAAVNEWIRDHNMTPSLDTDELDTEELSNPLTQIKTALRYRNVRMAIIMNFLFLFTELGVVAFLTTQLTQEVGLSLTTAAAVSGISGLIGWVGQIFWGTVSDYRGRKFAIGILSVGITLAVLSMNFITSYVTAVAVLLFWGVFRNSPYAVIYAGVIDSVPEAASSGMGLMIGVGLGLSGLISGPVAGYLIQHYGFTVDYIFLALVTLAALIPAARMRETAIQADETGSEVV